MVTVFPSLLHKFRLENSIEDLLTSVKFHGMNHMYIYSISNGIYYLDANIKNE